MRVKCGLLDLIKKVSNPYPVKGDRIVLLFKNRGAAITTVYGNLIGIVVCQRPKPTQWECIAVLLYTHCTICLLFLNGFELTPGREDLLYC